MHLTFTNPSRNFWWSSMQNTECDLEDSEFIAVALTILFDSPYVIKSMT